MFSKWTSLGAKRTRKAESSKIQKDFQVVCLVLGEGRNDLQYLGVQIGRVGELQEAVMVDRKRIITKLFPLLKGGVNRGKFL